MTSDCVVRGCHGFASGYGRYCDTHKTRQRRHGAAEQATITLSDLRPFLTEVKGWRNKNPDNRLWVVAEERWSVFGREVENTRRTTMHRAVRQAAIEVQVLAASVEGRKVVDTVLAMYLMQTMDPRRFASERGFRAQMVRRLRALSPSSSKRFDHHSGSTRKVLSELPPRVAQVMGSWLVSLLGQAGVSLSQRKLRDQQRQQEERRTLSEAIDQMDVG